MFLKKFSLILHVINASPVR